MKLHKSEDKKGKLYNAMGLNFVCRTMESFEKYDCSRFEIFRLAFPKLLNVKLGSRIDTAPLEVSGMSYLKNNKKKDFKYNRLTY